MLRSGFGGKTNKALSSCQPGRQRLPERFKGGADTIIGRAFGTPSLWFDARDGVATTAIESPICKIGAMTQASAGKRADLDVDAWKDGGPALVFKESETDTYASTSLNLNGTKLASLYTTLKNTSSDVGYAYEYTVSATSNNGCYISINDRPSGGGLQPKPFALNGQSTGYSEQYLDEEVDGTYGVLGASFDRSLSAPTQTDMSWYNSSKFNPGDTNDTNETPPSNNFDAGATSYIGARAGTTTAIDADVREIVAYGEIAHSEGERFLISSALAYKALI